MKVKLLFFATFLLLNSSSVSVATPADDRRRAYEVNLDWIENPSFSEFLTCSAGNLLIRGVEMYTSAGALTAVRGLIGKARVLDPQYPINLTDVLQLCQAYRGFIIARRYALTVAARADILRFAFCPYDSEPCKKAARDRIWRRIGASKAPNQTS